MSFVSLYAQDMQEGFGYLETGAYDKAKTFFEEILTQYPQNKTARLCYGRAVGLLGDSPKAVVIFTALKKEYPNDFEVKLNYAESLLWDKQYTAAEAFYETLIAEDDTSFAAVLGYANTLSNLKKYKQALEMVNNALAIQEGNPNALVSRKYVRLGYANAMSQDKKYQEALTLLADNLIDFPNDKDTQLTMANLYLMTNELDKAQKTYESLAVTPKDSITSLLGLSLVAHKMFKEKKALEIATQAKQDVMKFKEDKALYLSTHERYIQALLWNQKFKVAQQATKELEKTYPDTPRVLSLYAASGMYTAHFKRSLDYYSTILAKDASSFDGNLGIANAYRASGDDMMAYTYAFKTLQYYRKQPDAEQLIKTLKKSHTPVIQDKTAFSFDNGNNEALNTNVKVEVPVSARWKVAGYYDYRRTKNSVTNTDARSNDFGLGFLYKHSGRISLESRVGVTQANGYTNDFIQVIAEISLKTKPLRLQNLDIIYRRELQNFNADLLNREIIMNNYMLNYNFGTTFNLGWFTQLIYTTQTDENTRQLLFTSLYYTIMKRPVLKAGLNYQYLSFSDQVPTIYFSPSQFNLVEVFAEVVSDASKPWYYSASAALGRQFVEEDPASSTFRAEAKAGHRFSDRFNAHLYGKYSNIASATAAGFEYTEFGFRLRWYFMKKPIFDKKIEALRTETTK